MLSVQLPRPGGFACASPKVFLVCVVGLWIPSRQGLADSSAGGFKVPSASQDLWLLTGERSI